MHLFAYGSLMVAEVMQRVCRQACRHGPAILPEYRRGQLHGELFPAIVAQPGQRVEGVLYLDLTPAAWQRLDRFEGVLYRRQSVEVVTPSGETLPAETYVLQPHQAGLLSDKEWDLAHFAPHWRSWLEERLDF